LRPVLLAILAVVAVRAQTPPAFDVVLAGSEHSRTYGYDGGDHNDRPDRVRVWVALRPDRGRTGLGEGISFRPGGESLGPGGSDERGGSADRVQLKAHSETSEAPMWNLVVAKSGLKLKPSEPEKRGFMVRGSPKGSTGPGLAAGIISCWSGFAATAFRRPLSRWRTCSAPCSSNSG